MDDLKERRLKSLDYRIQELENQPDYFKKYGLRLLLIGILLLLLLLNTLQEVQKI